MESKETETRKLVGMVERHLQTESQMVEALEGINQILASILDEAGIKGPSQDDLRTLHSVGEGIEQLTGQLDSARKALQSQLRKTLGNKTATLKKFIRTLPRPQRDRLEEHRCRVLAASRTAQAKLLHNQVSLYYIFDFHRKYLAGVMQNGAEPQQYGANGQTTSVTPGNLIGKAC